MAKIDVIIPVYNVEKYLERCIESILNQTFRDFSLLLVDDGSTDRSGEICDKYAEKYAFIRAIHKENGGASDARNRGLEESGSEYITFIDSDDVIDSRCFEVLYGMARDHNADLAICAVQDVQEVQISNMASANTDGKKKGGLLPIEIVSKTEAYRRMLMVDGMWVSACGKLYRRKLFRNVRYPVGEISEDSYVMPQIVESCNRIACTRYVGYYYVRRKGSSWNQAMTPGHWAAVRNAKSHWDFIKKNYPEIEYAARLFYIHNCIQLINCIALGSGNAYKAESRQLRREILNQAGFILFGRYAEILDKCVLLCLLPGISFYRIVWRKYLKLTRRTI